MARSANSGTPLDKVDMRQAATAAGESCDREITGPSQATPAWTTLPDGVFGAILDKLCQSALAATRSTCKAWKASVGLHQKSLAATLSDGTAPFVAAFPGLQSLRVELKSSSAVLENFWALSALSQLRSLTSSLVLGGSAACLGARKLSQLPGSIRQLILSHAYFSTEGLNSAAQLGSAA